MSNTNNMNNTQTTLTANSLNFIMLHTSDLAATREFYTWLGFVVVDELPDFVQFAAPNGQGAAFGVGLLTPEHGHEPELWFDISDADAAFAQAQAQELEIVHPIMEMPFGRVFAIKDPAGYILHLSQAAQQG